MQDTANLAKNAHKSNIFPFNLHQHPQNSLSLILVTLAISVPISMAAGALLAAILLQMLRG